MGPKIVIDNRLNERIDFLMEVDGRVVGLGVCSIRSVEPNKIRKVSQRKVLSCCHRHESSWRVRVLVNGQYSGLIVEPIDLMNYKLIVFVYEIVDGGIVLKAKGLRTRGKGSTSRFLSQLRWSYRLGSRRHREYRMLEEMYGLEDVAELRMGDEGPMLEQMYGLEDVAELRMGDEGPMLEQMYGLEDVAERRMRDEGPMLEEMYGVEDVAEVPTEDEGTSEDSCQRLLCDEEKVLLPAYSLVSVGIHAPPTMYVTGIEVGSSTDEVGSPTDIKMCSSHSNTNALLEICNIDSEKGTGNIELLEDGNNYSATAKLWGSGRSASKRWLAFGKQKAMSLVGTANSLIATIYDYGIYDS